MKAVNEISVFENYLNPVPAGNVHIRAFVNDILGGTYRSEVEKIRANDSKFVRDQLKAKLPAVTISGTFSYRANDKLIQHSGFICIDIDTKPEGVTWETLRDTAGGWDHVYFSALSVSGQGLFLIIPIANPKKHLQHFQAIELEFNRMGIKIDKGCKDIARLRGLSFDPGACFNPDAKKYDLIYEPPEPRYTKPNGTIQPDKLTGWVESKGYSFVKGERHPYVTQLAGAYHRLGLPKVEAEGSLLKYQQSDFDRTEILKIVDHMYSKPQWKL